MDDREAPLLVHHPDPAADEAEEGVEAKRVGSAQRDPPRYRAVAVVAEEAERIGAQQRGAEVAAQIEEQLIVLETGVAEIRDHAAGDVPAHAIDGTGLQPERVVLHVGDVVGRDHAFSGHRERVLEQATVRKREHVIRVHAIRVFHAGLDLEPAELRERIAGDEEAAVRLLLIDVVERLVDEPAVPAEGAHTPVHPP